MNLELNAHYPGWQLFVVFAVAAGLCAAIIAAVRPLLVRYALAPPSVRSSHRQPTPQGGGIAVIGAVIIAIAGTAVLAPASLSDPTSLSVILACTIMLAALGVTDDLRPLEALPRLFVQAIAVLVVIAMLPQDLTVAAILPWWIERGLLFLALLWLVNAANFMDGIDWMTVAEVVPITAALALFGIMGVLPNDATLTSIALCGAMIGFAPFNRPVARLFLGDVGSLPIGLLLGWLLALLAGSGHLAAALLLPLYYIADATITLLRRAVNGEQITQAHRSHFYQRAMDGDLSVNQIVGHVFGINILLVGLATVTLMSTSLILHVLMLVAGSALVGALLYKFNRASR